MPAVLVPLGSAKQRQKDCECAQDDQLQPQRKRQRGEASDVQQNLGSYLTHRAQMLMATFGASQSLAIAWERADHAVPGRALLMEAVQAHQEAEKAAIAATEGQVQQLTEAHQIQQALDTMRAAEEALAHAPSTKPCISRAATRKTRAAVASIVTAATQPHQNPAATMATTTATTTAAAASPFAVKQPLQKPAAMAMRTMGGSDHAATATPHAMLPLAYVVQQASPARRPKTVEEIKQDAQQLVEQLKRVNTAHRKAPVAYCMATLTQSFDQERQELAQMTVEEVAQMMMNEEPRTMQNEVAQAPSRESVGHVQGPTRPEGTVDQKTGGTVHVEPAAVKQNQEQSQPGESGVKQATGGTAETPKKRAPKHNYGHFPTQEELDKQYGQVVPKKETSPLVGQKSKGGVFVCPRFVVEQCKTELDGVMKMEKEEKAQVSAETTPQTEPPAAAAAAATTDGTEKKELVFSRIGKVPQASKQTSVTASKPLPIQKLVQVVTSRDLGLPGLEMLAYKQASSEQEQRLLGYHNYGQTLVVDKSFSVLDGTPDGEELLARYHRCYVPVLNSLISRLVHERFESHKSAIHELDQILRSYIAGMRACPKGPSSATKFTYRCGTFNSSLKGKELIGRDGHTVKKCKWTVSVARDPSGMWFFEKIDDFSMHGLHCLCYTTRSSSTEVDEATKMPRQQYTSYCAFKQTPAVSQDSMRHRTCRENNKARAQLIDQLGKEESTVEIDKSLTNYEAVSGKEIGTDPSIEKLMRLLSYLHVKTQLECYLEFTKDEAGNVIFFALKLMWPIHKQRLERFNDVIFCDSLWNTCCGNHMLTVCIVDDSYHSKLAGCTITSVESTESWLSFYLWLKEKVPTMKPNCVFTDGATYIYKAYQSAFPEQQTVHMICWWHQQQNVERRKGVYKKLGKILLRTAYAKSEEELVALKKQYEDLLQCVNVQGLSRLQKDFEQRFRTARINIHFFTGGAISNNTAETVNSRLRAAQLSKAPSLWHNVCQLYSMMLQESVVRSEDTRQLDGSHQFWSVLTRECITQVNRAVLKRIKLLFEKPKCQVTLKPGSQWTDETVHVQELRELKDKVNKTTVTLHSEFTVKWQATVSCTCHMEVLSGLPCVHIITVAMNAKKQIPLSCIHKRFHSTSVHLVQCGQAPTNFFSGTGCSADGTVGPVAMQQQHTGVEQGSDGNSGTAQSGGDETCCSTQIDATVTDDDPQLTRENIHITFGALQGALGPDHMHYLQPMANVLRCILDALHSMTGEQVMQGLCAIEEQVKATFQKAKDQTSDKPPPPK